MTAKFHIIQVNSSALECPREERHTLICEPKGMCLKNRRNMSMMKNTFNAYVPHYFYNCLMAFSHPLMDSTSKRLSQLIKHPTNLRGNCAGPTNGPIRAISKHPVQPCKTQSKLFNIYTTARET